MLKMKITRREAVGIIGCISSWAIQYRPGGIIERKLIASAVEWEKDPKELVQALLDVGWLDEAENGSVKIHDWEDVTRNYRKSKADAEERTRRNRIARGEEPPDPKEKRNPLQRQDKSSTPEHLAAAEYCRINPGLHSFATVLAKIRAARKADAPMEKIHEACSTESICKDVEIWNVLGPLTPKFGKLAAPIEKADEILKKWDRDAKAAEKEHEKKTGEAVL